MPFTLPGAKENILDNNISIIIVIMIIAGAVGGTINYLVGNPEHHKFMPWLKATFIGIGAAFLVPLFLRTISSGLLANILAKSASQTSPTEDYFVFSGFCLLAAISSRPFIQTLSHRILKETKEARNEVAQVKAEVGTIEASVAPIVESMTEQEPEDIDQDELQQVSISPLERNVLNILAYHPRFTLRSLTGITQEANKEQKVEREEVRTALLSLAKQRLVVEILGKTGIGVRWSITPLGKAVLESA